MSYSELPILIQSRWVFFCRLAIDLLANNRLLYVLNLPFMKDFPWLNKYPKEVAREIQLYEYPSLVELFDESCEQYKDRVAYENMGVQLTYGQVRILSEHFAAFLQKDLFRILI